VHSIESGNTVHSIESGSTVHSIESGNTVHSIESGNTVHSIESGNTVHSIEINDTLKLLLQQFRENFQFLQEGILKITQSSYSVTRSRKEMMEDEDQSLTYKTMF